MRAHRLPPTCGESATPAYPAVPHNITPPLNNVFGLLYTYIHIGNTALRGGCSPGDKVQVARARRGCDKPEVIALPHACRGYSLSLCLETIAAKVGPITEITGER